MDDNRNEIEQFIYQFCYEKLFLKAQEFANEHPLQLITKSSKVKYPDKATINSLIISYITNININGDNLSFDATADCIINLHDNYLEKDHEVNKFLTISCLAVITDKLDNFEVLDIKPGKAKIKKTDETTLASKNIVPILAKKDLEKEAERFLKVYYPEALERPLKLPIREIANNMGLSLIEDYKLSNDFSVLGEICLSDYIVESFSGPDSIKETIKCKRGTIFIDKETSIKRNNGCVNNTIAHELYHWDKHRMYATIKEMLHGNKQISYRCPIEQGYPGDNKPWTDIEIMEWQANNLAPRILMPEKQFKIKAKEVFDSFKYKNDKPAIELAVTTSVADILASFYGVSRESVLIRLSETGFKQADKVLAHQKKSSLYALTNEQAFEAYLNNSLLRRIVDGGLFTFVEGRYVINSPEYIKEENGLFILQNKTKLLEDYTCLSFKNINTNCNDKYKFEYNGSEYIKSLIYGDKKTNVNVPFASGGFGDTSTVRNKTGGLMHRDDKKSDSEIRHEQFDRDSRDIELLKQAELDLRKNGDDKVCWGLIYALLIDRKINAKKFSDYTLLDQKQFSRAKNNEQADPSKMTLLSIACAKNVKFSTYITEELLKKSGHFLSDSFEDSIYSFCVSSMRDKDIYEINKFIEEECTKRGYEKDRIHPLGGKN